MPKAALADTILEWEQILAAIEARKLDLPHLLEQKRELEVQLAKAKALALEQDALRARRQYVTQELQATTGEGKDLVVKLRSTIRGFYGHRDELLVHFKIRPVRRRRRSRTEPETSSPMAAPTPPSSSQS